MVATWFKIRCHSACHPLRLLEGRENTTRPFPDEKGACFLSLKVTPVERPHPPRATGPLLRAPPSLRVSLHVPRLHHGIVTLGSRLLTAPSSLKSHRAVCVCVGGSLVGGLIGAHPTLPRLLRNPRLTRTPAQQLYHSLQDPGLCLLFWPPHRPHACPRPRAPHARGHSWGHAPPAVAPPSSTSVYLSYPATSGHVHCSPAQPRPVARVGGPRVAMSPWGQVQA